MPWNCCDTEHSDDETHCGICAKRKSSWTLRFNQTRRLVLRRRPKYEPFYAFEEPPSWEMVSEGDPEQPFEPVFADEDAPAFEPFFDHEEAPAFEPCFDHEETPSFEPCFDHEETPSFEPVCAEEHAPVFEPVFEGSPPLPTS